MLSRRQRIRSALLECAAAGDASAKARLARYGGRKEEARRHTAEDAAEKEAIRADRFARAYELEHLPYVPAFTSAEKATLISLPTPRVAWPKRPRQQADRMRSGPETPLGNSRWRGVPAQSPVAKPGDQEEN